jgi:cyclic pyranopterin phosphate synthase
MEEWMLVDRFGRRVTYLRVSVTDRCNLRCVYCMPPEGIQLRPRADILSFEEIAGLVRLAAQHGIQKVRLTGGEPLVRAGLPDLVRMIAAIPGIEDISLTTNGLLLERLAPALKDAGLRRVNVSLDTLNPEKFARITRGGSFETVWRGLEAAQFLGLAPIKINAVAMRGVNDDELLDLARLSADRGWHVRFIELMPVCNQAPWGPGFPDPAAIYLSIPEIKRLLEPLALVALPGHLHDGPAREFQIPGAQGRIGFISPLSEHFCEECNRLRLTADGAFRPCLLQDIEVPVLTAMRAGADVLPLMQQAVDAKPSGHELAQASLPRARCMLQIGG